MPATKAACRHDGVSRIEGNAVLFCRAMGTVARCAGADRRSTRLSCCSRCTDKCSMDNSSGLRLQRARVLMHQRAVNALRFQVRQVGLLPLWSQPCGLKTRTADGVQAYPPGIPWFPAGDARRWSGLHREARSGDVTLRCASSPISTPAVLPVRTPPEIWRRCSRAAHRSRAHALARARSPAAQELYVS